MKFTSISNAKVDLADTSDSFRTNEIYKYLKLILLFVMFINRFRTNEIYKYLKPETVDYDTSKSFRTNEIYKYLKPQINIDKIGSLCIKEPISCH